MSAQLLRFPKQETNLLSLYKDILAQEKAIAKEKEALKAKIFQMMDESKSDELIIDGNKASRSLVVQERLDTKKVKEFLGESVKDFQSEVSIIKLQIL